jgi:hypothetical protein
MSSRGHVVSPTAKLKLVVLQSANDEPGVPGIFTLVNAGTAHTSGTLYLDANPGQLNRPIEYLYVQVGDARHVRGEVPYASYDAWCDVIPIPTPRTFREVVEKMNEGQFLRLGPTGKGVCNVPASRRATVLRFLGFPP